MQEPAEIHSLGCVRNQAEEKCIPVERSLGREQQASDPVASCDANILCAAGQAISVKVSSGESWGKFGVLH